MKGLKKLEDFYAKNLSFPGFYQKIYLKTQIASNSI
jgi:hypothetical protein